jgi:hypothetical protein
MFGSARAAVYLKVDHFDDLGRRILGRADAVPNVSLKPGTCSRTRGYPVTRASA